MATSGGTEDLDTDKMFVDDNDHDLEEKRKKAQRCTKCQRITKGHEGKYGDKCQMKLLIPEELKEDDLQKLKQIVTTKKPEKRKGSQDEENEEAKKQRLENEESNENKEEKAEDERLRKAKEQNENYKKKMEERKKLEIENMKMSDELHNGARPKENDEVYEEWRSRQNPSNRMERDKRHSTPKNANHKKYVNNPARNHSPTRRSNARGEDGRYESSRRMDERDHYAHPRRPNDSRRMERRDHHDGRRSWSRRSRSRSGRSARSHRSRSSSRRMEEFANSMVNAMTRVNDNDDKKIDPVPIWDETTSFEGWKKELLIWSRARGRQERKTQLLVEYLKKETSRKGLKELVVNEFIENENFHYEASNAIQCILDKIRDFMDESKWNKTVQLVKDFRDFKQENEEKSKDFVTRFSTMETRMKNASSELPKLWLAAELLTKSRINGIQKHNILSNVKTDDNPNILKDIKKKLRDLDGCDTDENRKTFYAENKTPRERTPRRDFSRE